MNKNIIHPTNKASSILYIYDVLNSGVLLTKEELLDKFHISNKTVGRYIKEVNMHLSEEHIGKVVVYDTVVGGYRLCQKSQMETVLQHKDILVLSKILLESRGLNYEETQVLIEKLINHCNKKEQSFIKRMIGNEMENYIAPTHGKSLVEKIWQIHNAIKEQRKLKISYHRIGDDGQTEPKAKERVVFPQAVLFNEYYFYLCADIEGKEYAYPTIFRMDRIESYQFMEDHFRINYAQRFKEGEFRKITQFMYTGELKVIKFKYFGKSLEAVLDRLPTAEVVEHLDGGFMIRARVFGQGIMMWLLSQGDAVEVIEPISMRNKMEEKIDGMLKRYNKK